MKAGVMNKIEFSLTEYYLKTGEVLKLHPSM